MCRSMIDIQSATAEIRQGKKKKRKKKKKKSQGKNIGLTLPYSIGGHNNPADKERQTNTGRNASSFHNLALQSCVTMYVYTVYIHASCHKRILSPLSARLLCLCSTLFRQIAVILNLTFCIIFYLQSEKPKLTCRLQLSNKSPAR